MFLFSSSGNFFLSKRGVIYRLFLVWLLVSSIYYIDTLFTGEFAFELEEGFGHKLAKYLISIFFSFFFLIKSSAYFFAIGPIFFIFLAALLVFANDQVGVASITALTVGSMLGYIATFESWKNSAEDIARVVVFSGFVVGLFSVLEFLFFSENFHSYWLATGGMRSISTMFNPNNLGLYVGACLILYAVAGFSGAFGGLVVFFLIFALISSGSRTAWVSLALVFIASVASDLDLRRALFVRIKKRFLLFILFVVLVLVGINYIFLLAPSEQYESTHRGMDMYTASIRMENFILYFEKLDWSIVLPDWLGVRDAFVQDNVFLSVLNSFGLLLCMVTGIIILASRNFLLKSRDPVSKAWRWVVVYYFVSGLSGSFINSFPNNQLFFIALGAFIVRPVRLAATFPAKAV